VRTPRLLLKRVREEQGDLGTAPSGLSALWLGPEARSAQEEEEEEEEFVPHAADP
jgi:hypothetical protein